MLFIAVVRTAYLQDDDENGYYSEQQLPRVAVSAYLREDRPFSQKEFELLAEWEQKCFPTAYVDIGTEITNADRVILQKRFGVVHDWTEAYWLNKAYWA